MTDTERIAELERRLDVLVDVVEMQAKLLNEALQQINAAREMHERNAELTNMSIETAALIARIR